jgi:hypothetical protein
VSQHFRKCERCDKEIQLEVTPASNWGSVKLHRDATPDYWERDLCPECFTAVKDFLLRKPLEIRCDVTFDPKKMAEVVARVTGKITDNKKRHEGCTCPPPRTETTLHLSSFSWEYKPCPLHPTRVTI